MPVHKGPMKKKGMPPKGMPKSHQHMSPTEHEAAMKKMKGKKK